MAYIWRTLHVNNPQQRVDRENARLQKEMWIDQELAQRALDRGKARMKEELSYQHEIAVRAALLEIPFGRRKEEHDVAPGATISFLDGPQAIHKPQRKRTLKSAMIALVVALVAIVTTSTLSWKQRITTAIVAAAIAIAVSLFVPGCMHTAVVGGNEYSWRFDILAPIGATVPPPAWADDRPIYIQAAPAPTSQPAAPAN